MTCANVAAFGPNVCVFNDAMSQATIQADLDSIAKLADLHKKGALTDEEFAREKAKLLGT